MKMSTFLLLSAAVPLVTGPAVYAVAAPPPSPAELARSVPGLASQAATTSATASGTASSASRLRVEARAGHASLSRDGDRETFVLIQATGQGSPSDGPPASTDTALVIDRSGSMAGDRVTHAIAAARGWITRGADDDIVSVSTFAGTGQVLVPATPLSPPARTQMLQAVGGLVASGNTCLSCGMETGLGQVAPSPSRVRRLVVLSDGLANTGTVDRAGMDAFAHRCRDQGVSITTIGLGATYDEEMLGALSLASNGNHHFVATADDLPRVFEREAASLRATVVGAAIAEVTLGEDVEVGRVFDRTFERETNRLTIPLGPLAAGETKTVLMKLRIRGDGGTRKVADVRVRHRGASDDAFDVETRTLRVRLDDRDDGPLDPLVGMRVARAQTVEAVEEATRRFKAGDRYGSLHALDDQATALRRFGGEVAAHGKITSEDDAESIRRDLQAMMATIAQARAKFATTDAGAVEGRQAVRSMRAQYYPAAL